MLGPECYSKYAAFEEFLEGMGARGLAYGGSLKVGRTDSPEAIQRAHELILTLRWAGLRVEVEELGDEKRITLGGVEHPKEFSDTFRKDVWRTWAEKLKLKALAKEFFPEGLPC